MSLSDVAQRANEAIIDGFANADVLAEGYEPIRGIYTGPTEVAKLESGGFVEGEKASVIVKSSEGTHLERRVKVTVNMDSGETLDYQVMLPDNDGMGRLLLTLGYDDGRQSTNPAISY